MDKHIPIAPTHASQVETEDETDVEGAFGEHDIVYWVREGNRLVPATPAQIAAIQEQEALPRLAMWRSESTSRPRYLSHLRLIGRYMRRWFSLLLAHLRQRRAPHPSDGIQSTTGTQSLIPLLETQHEAARERHV